VPQIVILAGISNRWANAVPCSTPVNLIVLKSPDRNQHTCLRVVTELSDSVRVPDAVRDSPSAHDIHMPLRRTVAFGILLGEPALTFVRKIMNWQVLDPRKKAAFQTPKKFSLAGCPGRTHAETGNE
jgi:hypothetical protein